MTLTQRLTDILAAVALTLVIWLGIIFANALDGPLPSERPAGAGISLPVPASDMEDV